MRILSLLMAVVLFASVIFAAKPVSDDTISDVVRTKLAGDRDTGGGDIRVKVSQGIVELQGNVKTDKVRSRAEKLAKKTKGVKSVTNSLRVAPTP